MEKERAQVRILECFFFFILCVWKGFRCGVPLFMVILV